MKKEKGNENHKNKKLENLEINREDGSNEYLSTNQGVRIQDNQHQLKAGERGPSLLEDFIFREKMQHFDHERIPERVVHPRGSGAHGEFECYESMKEFTKASFLSEAGKKTPVFTRFSTVVGFRGSSDLARDVRGFAVKFYTDQGNYDLVGNNMPVFFIQDAMKFPDLVHSIKPEPHHQMPQATAAHDNFWDFASLSPESLHHVLWVVSDRGLPRSYRMMEGFGVHTFKWINEEGKVSFVKYHWKPVLGTHGILWDEAQKISGNNPDFHRRDLWEAINNGHYPEYELGVQIIAEEDEHKFDFDLLDPTKIVPEELVPVKKVGKMTLNRNPDNFFAETEQVAFHPGHIVPGVDFTNDPLLQGRLFSYLDTQLIRLGGPNFHEIPINRPIAPKHNNQRDGFMRQEINKGRTNYEPNSMGGGCPMQAGMKDGGFVSHTVKVEGSKIRQRSKSFNDYFSQSKLFYDSQSEAEQQHIKDAFKFELGKVETTEVQKRMVGLLSRVNMDLTTEVAEALGIPVPTEPMKPVQRGVPADADQSYYESIETEQAIKQSKALSMEHTVKGKISYRQVAFLCADGVDAESLKTMKEAIMSKGAMPKIIAPHGGEIKASNGDMIKVDHSFNTTSSVLFDAVYIPSGKSIDNLKTMAAPVFFVNQAFKHCKPIAAVGNAKEILSLTSFESMLGNSDMEDQGIIMKNEASKITDSFIKAIGMHRFWMREGKDKIPA